VRIKFVIPIALDEEGVRNRIGQIPEGLLLTSTEVVFVPAKNGPTWGDSTHDALLQDFFVYEEGMRSEEEGFDAVCVDSVSDSGVAALRSRLRIPVVGPGHVSYQVAGLLGRRFSILTMWDRWNHFYAKSLKEYGLESHCASIRNPKLVPDNRNLATGKEDVMFPALAECAWRCIREDGADVIILGSTTMHQAHAYLAECLPVPVINPGPLGLKFAETMVLLGLTHSEEAFRLAQDPKDQLFQTAADAVSTRPAGLTLSVKGR
jgi:allantoin racemase